MILFQNIGNVALF